MTIDLSILLVSWNTKALLRQCLEAIPASMSGFTYEVIVVDNASQDGSAAMVQHEFPEVQLIANSENYGFARGNNQAIAVSQGRHVVLLNTDTVPEADSLSVMVAHLDASPQVGVVGAHLLNSDGSFQFSQASFITVLGESLQLMGLAQRIYGPHFPSHEPTTSLAPQAADWVLGACLMIRKETIDQIGLLDEGYFMYTEETDWCYRVKQAGWQVHYLPTARVIHFGGQSAAFQPAAKRRQLWNSKVRFFRKHRGWLAVATFVAVIWLTAIFKMAYWFLISLLNRSNRPAAWNNVRAYLAVLSHPIPYRK